MRIPVIVLLLLAWATIGHAAPRYDTTVMVVNTGDGACEVAVAWDRVESHQAVARAVTSLARAIGARVSGLAVREEPLVRGTSARATSAEFRAVGLVRSGAPLPVEALARALPDWAGMRLAFLLGPSFTFVGPPQGEAAGAQFRLLPSANGQCTSTM